MTRRGNRAQNAESRQADNPDGDPARRYVQQMGSQRETDNENDVTDKVETKGHVEPPLRLQNEELLRMVHVGFRGRGRGNCQWSMVGGQ